MRGAMVMAAVVTMVALIACSKHSGKGGGGQNNASGAQSAGQQVSGGAMGNSSASQQGSSYESVTCDSSDDGIGFCATDVDLFFCSGGYWWDLDCSQLNSGGYCDCIDSSCGTVDCFDANGNAQ